MKQIRPKVLKKETKAIIPTGRRVVLKLPGRGFVLNGDGKYPSGSLVACGAKEEVDVDIVLTRAIIKMCVWLGESLKICKEWESKVYQGIPSREVLAIRSRFSPL